MGDIVKKLVFVLIALGVSACGGDQESGQANRQGTHTPVISRPGDSKDRQPKSGETAPDQTGYFLDDVLRINEIQFKGSHNSYHRIPEGPSPEEEYEMPPLTDQLALHGVRAVELDLHYYEGAFYVYHLPVDDDRSTCPRLRDCLAEILAWSQANAGHHVLQVYFDFRDTWDAEKIIDHLEELDALLFEVWPREKLLIPDDIVGGSANMAAAIGERGWPTLGQTRGKTMFIMWSFGDAPWLYAHEGTSLQGRSMFVAATYEGWAHAMVLGMDTAHEQEETIRSAVGRGYFVRTRSDDLPGRGGDFPARREAALRSGAQAILTDYPADGSLAGYTMDIPGGTPSRCNPITAPAQCVPHAVEQLE
jgi:hypothetical protein